MKNFRENLMHMVFFLCALTSIFAVVLICIFLFANGVPAMKEIGLLDFLTGAKWKPGNDIYGILPMILGSLYITAGAIVIGVPIGLLTAVFMAFYCPKKLYGLLKPCTELLAGIPSIVYGFFGMVIIVPAVRAVADWFDVDISGSSILLIAGVYLPTIQAIHSFLRLQLDVVPGLCALGFGVIAGVGLSIHAIRAALRSCRSQMVWLILGLMLGSLYAIANGPASLDTPLPPLDAATFQLPAFLLGTAILLALEGLKKATKRREQANGALQKGESLS